MECTLGLVSSTYEIPQFRNPVTEKAFISKRVVKFSSSSNQSQQRLLKCNMGRVGVSQSLLSETVEEANKVGICTNEDATKLRSKHVRTLLIDNYDSYTYNIYQQLSTINGVPPVVIQNNEWTLDRIQYYLYKERAFDNIVISPGPGSPQCPADMGVCLQVLLECDDIPLLGVCLGHQALGYVHGARIIHAPVPVHGRLSEVTHNGCSLFHDIPSGSNSGFKVVRYHSLIIDADSLPAELTPIAWTTSTDAFGFYDIKDQDRHGISGSQTGLVSSVQFMTNGKSLKHPRNFWDTEKAIVMGIMHTSRPHYGVQFHPESVATSYGKQIFENFKKITLDYLLSLPDYHGKEVANKVSYACNQKEKFPTYTSQAASSMAGPNLFCCQKVVHTKKSLPFKFLKLHWKKFDSLANKVGGSGNIFSELFGHQKAANTFWLDSSSTDLRKARFSFMGGRGGSLWKQITFWLTDKSNNTAKDGGYLSIEDGLGSVETRFLKHGFFDFMKKELQTLQYSKEEYEGLPFDFCGGYIGFIGYDLKVECGAKVNCHKAKTPDACFFFADNLLVVDHQNDDVYLLSLQSGNQSDDSVVDNGTSWLETTEERLLELEAARTKYVKDKTKCSIQTSSQEGFKAEKSRDQYLKDIMKCQKFIKDGESYELCLTTQMRKKVEDINGLGLYLNLREKNPAPYAAWLNFSKEDLCICCSSPERFLRLDRDEILEAKPIKGTIARGMSSQEDEQLRMILQHSEKDQAENLMIVDLLRNDLGRVCEPGSVHVPRLMEVESYATVHTMVSTIRGQKKTSLSPIDCVRAAFPGGSMTGSPKLRSMELLDSMESSSRGIYSGCIGYFSYNQRFDLNIVIRTIVIHKGEASIGAGGAITTLSKPEDEYEEMMLKTKAPVKAVMENHS